jgi:MraZ protein
MFFGQYDHSLDDKGRVILPAKFRHLLESGAYMSKGRERCLAVYTTEGWNQVAQQVQESAKRGQRERLAAAAFFAGATDAAPDKQGRVVIPPVLREYAGLDRDLVIAGQFTHIEIWDAARWATRTEAGDDSLADPDLTPEFGL